MNKQTTPLVSGAEVLGMIPQKPPIVMIDKIIAVSAQKATTALTIKTDNVFCQDNHLQAAGLTENIAQTAAAQVGYLAHQAGEKPPVGFIGAIKNLKIHQLPKVGDEITTTIEVEHEIMHFTLINGTAKLGENILAACQMKIFVHDNENENK